MSRVVKQGGTVGLLVPSELERQVAFAPFLDIVARHAGPEALSLMSSYFVCGSLDGLTALVDAAGLTVTTSRVQSGTYTAPSVDAAVANEIESTPLRERISDDVRQHILEETRELFAPYTTTAGTLKTPFDANLVVARR